MAVGSSTPSSAAVMIEAAIDTVTGIASYDLTLPAADVTFASGHLPAVPTVTFT